MKCFCIPTMVVFVAKSSPPQCSFSSSKPLGKSPWGTEKGNLQLELPRVQGCVVTILYSEKSGSLKRPIKALAYKRTKNSLIAWTKLGVFLGPIGKQAEEYTGE